MKTFLVTGATRGLGLDIARALASNPEHRVVLAVRDTELGARVAKPFGGEVKRLDLSSLAAVRDFVAAWKEPLAGLVNNAGVQLVDGTRHTKDGYEETFAVNHLAAFELTLGLLPRLRGGRVLFLGSGTHNPETRNATRFGFRGARFTSVEALARGDTDATTERQAGLDRYATSKLLNTVLPLELARRFGDEVRFNTLDPGPMPGTGLVRTAPVWMRFGWSVVLPVLARVLPEWSTTRRSAATATWMLTEELRNGATYDYDRQPSRRLSPQARDPALARLVYEQSVALLGTRGAAEERAAAS